ncbi:hypothetical protein [Treponema sp.]|uniref:hypothetical protein n=1 Tax=Treponema sp. TaxID=166 RepID=UPI003F0F3741
MKIKICTVLSFLIFFLSAGFAKENPGSRKTAEKSASNQILSDAVSHLDFSAYYVSAFPFGDMEDYSKSAAGAGVGVECEILRGIVQNAKIGILFNFDYLYYFPVREEVENLDMYNLLWGIWYRWQLPQDISIQADAGAGISISRLKVLTASSGVIDDVYYDFLARGALSVRKAFVKTEHLTVSLDTGARFSYQQEESRNFFSAGPKIGFVFNFMPDAVKK